MFEILVTNTERDRFLTEFKGECWHEGNRSFEYSSMIECSKCGDLSYNNYNFSSANDFLSLWNWARKQGWWGKFWRFHFADSLIDDDIFDLVNPDTFANALYLYLNETKGKH